MITLTKKTTQGLALWMIPAIALAFVTSCSSPEPDIEKEVAEYIEKFPYQDTYDYAVKYTDGDPAKLNTWSMGEEPVIVEAGKDTIVRMNNDTYYKIGFVLLDEGPVVLEAVHADKNRFCSFQLMDDHNVNFSNLIHPEGKFVLYHGTKPADIEGEAVESPSSLVAVIVRVELKDKDDADDIAAAKKIFNGISMTGPAIKEFPKLDLLSGFDEKVAEEANKRIKETFETSDFSDLVAGTGDVPTKVSYLQLAAGTKVGWGGPVTSHSAYETFFTDAEGKDMKGGNGAYTITTEAPPVDAFWSITVYDSDRGGYFHPNKDNRYHINNTSAVANEDGTFTFTFKTQCEEGDKNCLEVPEGKFDVAARYYLPKKPITDGEWKMPRPALKK